MKNSLKILLLLLLSHSAMAQQRWWHFVNGWTAGKSLELEDGSFLVSGNSYQPDYKDSILRESVQFNRLSASGDSLDSWYIRIDSFNGKSISANEASLQQSLIMFRNRVIVGNLLIYNKTYDACVMRLDSGLHRPDIVRDIRTSADRYIIQAFFNNADTELLVLGNYHMATRDVNYTFLMALDTNLNIKWQKQYTLNTKEDLVSNQIISDGKGGYLLSCSCIGYDFEGFPYTYRQMLIRTNDIGNEVWRLPFQDDSLSIYGLQVAPVGNGEFLAFYTDNDYKGTVDPNGYQQPNVKSTILASKFNLDKKVFWKKDLRQIIEWRFSVPEVESYTSDILALDNGKVALSGILRTQKNVKSLLLVVDSSGEVLWTRGYNVLPNNNAEDVSNLNYSLTPTSDKGFLLTGEYQSSAGNIFTETTQKGLVIKVDSLGCLEGGCDRWDGILESIHALSFSIYPNPVHQSLYVNASQDITSVRIYDVNGRVVREERRPLFPLDVSILPAGLYVIQLQSKDGIQSEKFLKE